MADPPKLFSTKQTASILKIDESRVRQLCRAGRLGKTPRTGKAYLITQEEIDEYTEIGPLKSGPKPKPKPQ